MSKVIRITENKNDNSQEFILESSETTLRVLETDDNGRPSKVAGSAGKAGIINGNNRLYPTSAYNKATDRAQEAIKKGKLLGEVDHPSGRGSLSRASARYTKLEMNGDLLNFEAKILSNPAGDHLASLLQDGVGVGVSTRGYASYEMMDVGQVNGINPPEGVDRIMVIQDDLEWKGIDFVLNESNPFGSVKHFEDKNRNPKEEGGKDMTLEELKKEHPELIAEHAKEVKKSVEEEMSTGLKTKISEAKEEGKNEVLESEKVKSALAIVESVKKELGAETVNEDVTELKDKLTLAEKAKVKAEEAKKEAEGRLAKIEEEKSKKDAIEEACKDYAHADKLATLLAECDTADKVKEVAEAKKAFIDSLVGEGKITEKQKSKSPKGKGIVEDEDGDEDLGEGEEGEEALTEAELEKQRQKRLAGL